MPKKTSKDRAKILGSRQPTVGQSFATAESAYTILRELLPPAWIIRTQTPDFHIDYLVEPTVGGELTGVNLGIQLKGWAAGNRRAAKPTHSLKTKHLLYYLEKCELPVFLVLIDINNCRGYWVFTQQFGNGQDREKLRKQKRILVTFSLQDSLADTPRFTQAVDDAVKYLRELRPSSINAAIAHRKKELEAKDPRTDVQIDLVNGQQKVTIKTKEQIPFTVAFKTNDPKTIDSIKDFVEKGTDLIIRRDEIEFSGSPLFEDLKTPRDEKLLIRYEREKDGHGVFSWGESDPQTNVYIPGQIRIAEKFLTFNGSLPGSPFSVTATIPKTIAYSPEPFSICLEFSPRRWENLPLLTLPHFDSVQGLFAAVFGSKEVLLRLYVQGNLLGTSRVDDANALEIQDALNFLETLKRARTLAARFHINPVLPPITKSLERELLEIDELHSVLFSNEHRSLVRKATVSFNGHKPAGTQSLDEKFRCGVVVQQNSEYKIFGQPVQVGPIRVEITELKLVRETTIEPGLIRFELEGTENSERVVRYGGMDISNTATPNATEIDKI